LVVAGRVTSLIGPVRFKLTIGYCAAVINTIAEVSTADYRLQTAANSLCLCKMIVESLHVVVMLLVECVKQTLLLWKMEVG
jgi:hypothetical protein